MESELLNDGDVWNQQIMRSELVNIIELRNMSIVETARDISVSSTTLYNFINGKKISFRILIKIANGIEKIKENRF